MLPLFYKDMMELMEQTPLTMRVGRLMKFLGHYYQREFESTGAELPFEFWIKLYALSKMKKGIQKSLADFSGIHKATITRLIDQLEELGLVTRSQDPEDRRQNLIEITEKGQAMIDKYYPVLISAEKRLLEGIDEKDVDTCGDVLDIMWTNCKTNCED